MKNEALIKSACLVMTFAYVMMMTGCSHNLSTTIAGKWFRIGGEGFSISYANGLVVMSGTRENAESIIETNDADALGNQADVKAVRTIHYRVGPQLTGYTKDLAKVCPEAAIEYVKNMHKLNTIALQATSPQPAAAAATAKSGGSKKDNSSDKADSGEKSDDAKDAVDKIVNSDYIQSLIEKVKKYYKDNGKETKEGTEKVDYSAVPKFEKDGRYTELYIYEELTEQKAIAEALLKFDDGGKKFGTGETYKTTLEHFLDRLEKVRKFGGTTKTAMRVNYAEIKDGKLVDLYYIMFEDDKIYDVDCPSCYSIENAKYNDDGTPIYQNK